MHKNGMFLTEEQLILLSTDLSSLLIKFEKNIQAASQVEEMTKKVEELELRLTNSLKNVNTLVENTETKNEEVIKFISQVSLSSNQKLIQELSSNFDENKKIIEKQWKETKEQMLNRKKDLLEITEEAMKNFESIFSNDKLALIIKKNMQEEYFNAHNSLETAIEELKKGSLFAIENSLNALLSGTKELNRAKEKLELSGVIIDSKFKMKSFIKGVLSTIIVLIIIVFPFFYFFTEVFNSIKSNVVTIDKNAQPIDKRIINYSSKSYYVVEEKEDFLVLKNIK